MSGVWERLVQTTKKHLKSVAGNWLLNDLELRILFAEIESIVNKRPITAVSDDPADLTALTPNHFLLQRVAHLPLGVFVSEEAMDKGPVAGGPLLEALDARVSSSSPKKTKMGRVKKECATW